MATTTDPRYSSALPVSAKRCIELMSGGDDDLRCGVLTHAVCLLVERFIEADACSLLSSGDDDELHAQFEILLDFNNASYPYWNKLWQDRLRERS